MLSAHFQEFTSLPTSRHPFNQRERLRMPPPPSSSSSLASQSQSQFKLPRGLASHSLNSSTNRVPPRKIKSGFKVTKRSSVRKQTPNLTKMAQHRTQRHFYNANEDEESVSDKFTTLMESFGTCASDSIEFLSAVLYKGTKSIYNLVNSIKTRREVLDETEDTRSLELLQSTEIQIKNDTNKISTNTDVLFTTPKPKKSITTMPSYIKTTEFLTKSTSTSSSVTSSSSISSSSSNSFASLRALQFSEGIKRHKLGLLQYPQSLTTTAKSARPVQIHGGGQRFSIPSSPKYGHNGLQDVVGHSVGNTPNWRPLQYSTSWYYTRPPFELPEKAPSTESYAKIYMELVARRERELKELEEAKKLSQIREQELKQKDRVEPLSETQIKQVNDIWQRRDSESLVASANRVDVKIRDIDTLRDGQWLNDTVIDFYLALVTQRSRDNKVLSNSFVFSTHFFTTLDTGSYDKVKRWAKRKGADVAKLDYIFVPVNRHNTHWCLAVINNKERKFQFYDSMNGAGLKALHLLKDYMYRQTAEMHPEMSREEMGYDDYEIIERSTCPQQSNSYDCGVFVCKMVDVLSRDRDVMSFGQKDMRNIRRRMAYEIITSKLLI